MSEHTSDKEIRRATRIVRKYRLAWLRAQKRLRAIPHDKLTLEDALDLCATNMFPFLKCQMNAKDLDQEVFNVAYGNRK